MQLIFTFILFASTLTLSSVTGTNLEIQDVLSSHLTIQHHLSRRATEWDTSDGSSDSYKLTDGIQAKNQSLTCATCLAFVGLEGCKEISSVRPVTNPDICYTARVKYNVGGSLNAEVVIKMGGKRKSLLAPTSDFDGTCAPNSKMGPFLQAFVGPAAKISDVQVCGCFENNCNDYKPTETETTQLNIEQDELPVGALKCDNCFSIQGLDGCIPLPKNFVKKNPEMCMTYRATGKTARGSEMTFVAKIGAHLADFEELTGSSIIDDECKKISSRALPALSRMLPPGTSITAGDVCVCKTDYCNRHSSVTSS